MALYQGEDIVISLSGDDIINLENNNFVVLFIPNNSKQEDIIIQGMQFSLVPNENEKYYMYAIPSDVTKNMLGLYDLEIKTQNKNAPYNKSIFKKKDALLVNKSKIKDIEITAPNT